MAQKALFENGVSRNDLNALVDKAADLIRTAVDYKFILVLLFLKRLNDVWRKEREKARARLIEEGGLSEKEAEREVDETSDFYTINIPKKYLWNEVAKDVKNLPEKLATSISEIAKLNKELQGVLDREKVGYENIYTVHDEDRVAKVLVAYKSSFMDTLVDKTLATWMETRVRREGSMPLQS